jgi:hypothetical protein
VQPESVPDTPSDLRVRSGVWRDFNRLINSYRGIGNAVRAEAHFGTLTCG